MLRCAITDGAAAGFVNTAQIDRLRRQVQRWASSGIDLIQLREKNLDAGALLALAEAAMRTLDEMQSATKLLINARVDVAIAARAHGVHLTTHPDELAPKQVRDLYARGGLPSPVVSVSCHSLNEVERARDNGADFILFGPVFEKCVGGEQVSEGIGLDRLREICRLAQPVRVLALGGVTVENIPACVAAGASGIAGIRLFS